MRRQETQVHPDTALQLQWKHSWIPFECFHNQKLNCKLFKLQPPEFEVSIGCFQANAWMFGLTYLYLYVEDFSSACLLLPIHIMIKRFIFILIIYSP